MTSSYAGYVDLIPDDTGPIVQTTRPVHIYDRVGAVRQDIVRHPAMVSRGTGAIVYIRGILGRMAPQRKTSGASA